MIHMYIYTAPDTLLPGCTHVSESCRVQSLHFHWVEVDRCTHVSKSPNLLYHVQVVASAGEATAAFAAAAAAAAAHAKRAADAAARALEIKETAAREAAAFKESLNNEIRMDAAVEAITGSLVNLADDPDLDTDSLDFHLSRPSTISEDSNTAGATPLPPPSELPTVEEGGETAAVAGAVEPVLGTDPSFATAGLGVLGGLREEEELGADPSFAHAAAEGGELDGMQEGEEAQEIDFGVVAPAEEEEGVVDDEETVEEVAE